MLPHNQLTQHAYLDKKGLTLQELQATCTTPVYIKKTSLWREGGYYVNNLIFREMVSATGDYCGAERILPEKIDRYNTGKLNDKFITSGGSTSSGFTPMGFNIDELPNLTGKLIVCTGFSDGYRLHQASGFYVACGMGEKNIDNLCREILAVNPDIKIIVATDNDYAGIISAHATNLPYIIPVNSKDWSDVYQNPTEGLHALKQQINNVKKPLPLFPNNQYPLYQKRQVLKDNLNKMVNKLGRCKDFNDATSLAMSLFEKYEFKMPFEVSSQEFTERLVIACKNTFHCQNLKQIKALIDIRIDQRQKKSKSLTNFNYKTVSKRHNVIRLNGLPQLQESDFKGVVLIRAWKGIGKNDYIATPYIEAVQNHGLTLAMCHRMSLTRKLADDQGLTHYKEFTNISEVLGLAICSPSITKDALQYFIDNVEYIFVDEISQVLRFLRAKECSSGIGKSLKTNADVYQKLKQIVTTAKCILGVDAELNDRVINFIENCRPNEVFTIYDIDEKFNKQTPTNFKKANKYPAKKRTVSYVLGKEALVKGYGDILSRVRANENIWIAVEACNKTAPIAQLILDHKPDTKVLVINAKTKNTKKVKAFFADAERESLKYQVIIHSPVISSGFSIIHKNRKPHFSHTYFVGSGGAIVPSDASQMLARVRYIDKYTVVLLANNTQKSVIDSRSIITGKEQAALFEKIESESGYEQMVAEENLRDYHISAVDKPYRATEFDKFCAQIEEDESIAKADFSAGLLWLLKEEGHNVTPLQGEYNDIQKEITAAKEQAQEEFEKHLINAINIDATEYLKLKSCYQRNWEETCQYLKYYIMNSLNLKELTSADLELWDDGRCMAQMRRYSACFNQTAFLEKENIEHLSHRNFSKAKVWGYQYIFNGMDLSANARITQQQAKEIIDRVIKHRYVFAEIGLIPRSFGKWYNPDAQGNDTFPARKTPIKDVQSIFRLMGLKLNRKDNYHRATNQNDYQISADEMTYSEELCKKIDFSRLGGYLLNSNAGNAEINAEIWQKTKETALMLVLTFGEPSSAISYLNKACEKNGFNRQNHEINEFYQELVG